MNYEQIMNGVAQIGFPIFAFLMLWYLLTHHMERATKAVNNNTLVMERLVSKLP